MKTYSIITFGCAMNRSDSERIGSVLENLGYSLVKKNKVPDLLIFNSCSVRQSAIDRIYGQMGKFTSLKKKNPGFKTAITGCILPKDKKKFAKKFDFVFNIKDLNGLAAILASKKTLPSQQLDCFAAREDKVLTNPGSYFRAAARKQGSGERNEPGSYFKIKPKRQSRFSGLIPISFGCSRFCAYCAVPYTRGLEIDRPSADILAEVANLISHNYKEIWLLGQTVSSWKDPDEKNYAFVDLLEDVEKIPGKFWVRFHSPYVLDFNDRLIDFLAKAKKTNNYFNLPLQSGNDRILKKMNRQYSVGRYLKVLSKLKKRIKDFNFSTDIIIGFCGETEKQFQGTFNIFKKISPAMAYIAKYSVRPGTMAAKAFKDSVSLKIKKQRHAKLTKLLRQTAKNNLQKEVGKTLEVLVDSYLPEKKECLAKTKNFKTVRFKGNKALLGKFVRARIIKAREFELEGKPV